MSSHLDEYRIASVVLNYNSEEDLKVSVTQLHAQQGIRHSVIIVDNASAPDCVSNIQDWVRECYANAIIGTVDEVHAWVKTNLEKAKTHGCVYLMRNHENRGYSAGNNIGIRLAELLGSEAVLIVDPDMRIEAPSYIARVAEVMFADDKHCVAASRIIGMDGKDQSPLREPTFWEELFWPRFALSRWLGRPVSNVLPVAGMHPRAVPKVSGCCLLLRTDFLQATGYLDEGVFLYCEEPILAAKVAQHRGRIVFAPALSATHAHRKNEKGNASRNMLRFINSRKFYLQHYSGYGRVKKLVLQAGYGILTIIHLIKSQE